MGLFRRKQVDLNERMPGTGIKAKDLLVLEQMVKHGAEMSQPRHVLYYLYFPSEARAAEAGDEAKRRLFEVEVGEPGPEQPQTWSLICQRHNFLLDLEAVRVNGDFFDELALRHQGDYDGWEASIG
jgi:hypothetical protein